MKYIVLILLNMYVLHAKILSLSPAVTTESGELHTDHELYQYLENISCMERSFQLAKVKDRDLFALLECADELLEIRVGVKYNNLRFPYLSNEMKNEYYTLLRAMCKRNFDNVINIFNHTEETLNKYEEMFKNMRIWIKYEEKTSLYRLACIEKHSISLMNKLFEKQGCGNNVISYDFFNCIDSDITIQDFRNIEHFIICVLNGQNSLRDVQLMKCNENAKAFIISYVNIYRALLCYFSLELNDMPLGVNFRQIDQLMKIASQAIERTGDKMLIDIVNHIISSLQHEIHAVTLELPHIEYPYTKPAPVTIYSLRQFPPRDPRYYEFYFYWEPIRRYTPFRTMEEYDGGSTK